MNYRNRSPREGMDYASIVWARANMRGEFPIDLLVAEVNEGSRQKIVDDLGVPKAQLSNNEWLETYGMGTRKPA